MSDALSEREATVASRIEQARQPAPAVSANDPLQVSDTIWAGDTAIKLSSGEPLPDQWEKQDSIALRSDTPIMLAQLAGIISSQTRIPIRLTGGAESVDADLAAAQGGGAGSGGTVGSGGRSDAIQPGIVLAYEGPLSGLLNLISGYYNVNWSYKNGTIFVNRYVTRSFTIDALPGSIAVAAGGDSGGEGASSASAAPLATATIDIWAEITATINSIIGDSGQVTISQSLGTIVVSTTTDLMERVAQYIEEENERLSRQVAVTIDLYTLSVTDENAYGLDLTAALSSISGLPPINFNGITSGVGEGSRINITLVEPNELAGSTAVFRALSTLGKATRVAQIPITTLNNRPATQRIALDQVYVSSLETTTVAGSDSPTVTAETDTVSTGISVSILPRIMSDGRVLLQYALAQGELIRLRNLAFGDNTIQLPETQGLSFSQQVLMRSGSTLVLAGFDQSDIDSSARGVGRPMTWLFGGGTTSSNTRNIAVIAITPREITISPRKDR